MAFPAGWSHKWPITINADSVISSPVADWPCLITDAHFPAGAWAQMQATGADLRFSLDETGATELYYDAPRLSVAGESAHLYVAVPSLASGADTTIWAWVGNAEATAPSAAWMQGTYPAAWVAFWPMEEGSGNIVDRISGRVGTLVNGAAWVADGAGGYVVRLAGNNADAINVDVTDLATLLAGNALTVAAGVLWNGTGGTTTWRHISRHGTGQWTHILRINNSSPAGTLLWGTAATGYVTATGSAIAASVYHTIAGIYDGAKQNLYIDGAKDATYGDPAQSGNLTFPEANYAIGNELNQTSSWAGDIYWYALLKAALSADENAAMHLMLSSPATFATAGELVAVGGSHYPAAKYLVLLKRPVTPPVGSGQTGDTCYGEVRNLDIVS